MLVLVKTKLMGFDVTEPGYTPDPSNSSIDENLLAESLWTALLPGKNV